MRDLAPSTRTSRANGLGIRNAKPESRTPFSDPSVDGDRNASPDSARASGRSSDRVLVSRRACSGRHRRRATGFAETTASRRRVGVLGPAGFKTSAHSYSLMVSLRCGLLMNTGKLVTTGNSVVVPVTVN